MINLTTLNTTELTIIVGIAAPLVAGIVGFLVHRKRRSERLRPRFSGAEYARAVQQDGNRRDAEARLEERTKRVEQFHVRALAAGDRARLVESWRGIQSRFVDGPAGAVTEADLLLGDVLSTRGYPVSKFEQRAADISVDHHWLWTTTETLTKSRFGRCGGQASTEELRQAMVHYRTLFEELVKEPDRALMTAAS